MADFVYRRPGPNGRDVLVVEDVKGGAATPLAKLKLGLLRLWLAQTYGDLAEVRVVE